LPLLHHSYKAGVSHGIDTIFGKVIIEEAIDFGKELIRATVHGLFNGFVNIAQV
jgi:hypothetical protein